MRLIKKQIAGQAETEIEIRYEQMNPEVADLIRRIEQTDDYLIGTDNGRQYKVRLFDIYYAESVDKKTFLYTREAVFRSELKFCQLPDKLAANDFVQVNRQCLVNMDMLESIRTLPNSRLEATLINGEKITVSRTYLAQINRAFAAKEDME